MANYKHGVYVNEVPTSLIAPVTAESAVQVIFGTAPVNMAKDIKAAVNTPVLAYSLQEAVEKMGYSDNFEAYTLCQSISASFSVFNVAPIIMVNVLDPETHKKNIAEKEYSVVNDRVVLAQEGILLDTVEVKLTELGDKLEVDKKYVLSFDNNGYTVVSYLRDKNEKGEFTEPSPEKLFIKATAIDPTIVTENDLIGGYNASQGTYKGLELISQIYPRLGIVPCQILAPGWSHKPTVATVMKAKKDNINGCFKAMAICDIDTQKVDTYDEAFAWKNNNSYVDSNTVALWPMAKVGDKKYYMSALWAALTAYVDSKHDSIPYKSPSNEEFRITATVLSNDKEVYLDQQQANLLNSQGICTAINLNGWRSWGNDTSVYPSNTDVKDRFIACRRMFNWWSNTFILTYFQKVDDPMNPRLIEAVVDSENIRANGFKARGAIADGKMTYSVDENPVTDILNGTIRFHQHLAFWTPAQSIENIMEFNPYALQAALGGAN